MTSAPQKTAQSRVADQPLDAETLVRAGQDVMLHTLRAEMVALTTVMANLSEPHGHGPQTEAEARAQEDAVEGDFDNMPI